jgi:hypothetical protein
MDNVDYGVIGQSLGDAPRGMIGNPGKDVSQPGTRIDIIELTRLNQRIAAARRPPLSESRDRDIHRSYSPTACLAA